jgi:hypothetical protein
MPAQRYARRRYARRSTRSYKAYRTRYASARTSINRGLRSNSQPIVKATVMGLPYTLTSGSVSDNLNSAIYEATCRLNMLFQLNSVTTAANYIDSYLWYRIKKVDVWATTTFNQSAVLNSTEPVGGVNPAYFDPLLHWDRSATNVPSSPSPSLTSLTESPTYGNVNLSRLHTVKWTIYPNFMGQVNNPPLTSAPAAAPSFIGWTKQAQCPWISTQNAGPLVSGTGLRLVLDPISPATTPSGTAITFNAPGNPCKVTLYCRYYLEFCGQGASD